jgi:hypothetical protein
MRTFLRRVVFVMIPLCAVAALAFVGWPSSLCQAVAQLRSAAPAAPEATRSPSSGVVYVEVPRGNIATRPLGVLPLDERPTDRCLVPAPQIDERMAVRVPVRGNDRFIVAPRVVGIPARSLPTQRAGDTRVPR